MPSRPLPTESREADGPLVGLPPDLVRILRDQSIIVPQDQAVFEQIAKWSNAPTNTASAGVPHDPEYVPGGSMSFHRCRRCGEFDLGGWPSATCPGGESP